MFKPFQQGDESEAIHDLTFENDSDRISIYGNLQIDKDQHGLELARKLQAFFNDLVEILEQQPDLPEKLLPPETDEIENPFF